MLAALTGEQRAGGCVRVVPQDAARDRLALDPLHHETRAEAVVRLEQEPDTRRGDAAVMRRLQERELDRAFRPSDRGPGIAAEHEAVSVDAGRNRVERPRLARRAARQAPEPFDRHRLPEMATDRRRELLVVDAGGHGAER